VHILVRGINIEDRQVEVEVRRSLSLEHFRVLNDYVGMCQNHGFENVIVGYQRHVSQRTLTMLTTLAKTYGSIKLVRLTRDRVVTFTATNGSYVYQSRNPKAGTKWSAEHTIRFFDLPTAVDHINDLVLLTGSSIPLDRRCLDHLQLCLYELIANTVEHALFKVDSPEIQIRLLTHSDSVHVSYRDNAESFQSIFVPHQFIHHRIKAGEKRGLGLFLLQQFCETFDHERDDDWNITTFCLKRNIQPQEV